MTRFGKRFFFARGKGYLSATGPQSRFIIFLILTLVFYTLLLKIFQKIAAIVELPVFLPISLVTLLVFIGIVGTLYSHKFMGPLARIRRTIEQIAEGDMSVTLRLRESDDPMLKDLVSAISQMCEYGRQAHHLIRESAQELFADIEALQEKVRQGADRAEIEKQMESVRKKQEALDKAIKSFRKI
jgi:methyl-accepting chemotaxis protein